MTALGEPLEPESCAPLSMPLLLLVVAVLQLSLNLGCAAPCPLQLLDEAVKVFAGTSEEVGGWVVTNHAPACYLCCTQHRETAVA